MPHGEYTPYDHLEIHLGGYFFLGKEGTEFLPTKKTDPFDRVGHPQGYGYIRYWF